LLECFFFPSLRICCCSGGGGVWADDGRDVGLSAQEEGGGGEFGTSGVWEVKRSSVVSSGHCVPAERGGLLVQQCWLLWRFVSWRWRRR
jgi:hypothetical protein